MERRALGSCTTGCVTAGFKFARDRTHIERLLKAFGRPPLAAEVEVLGRYVELVATWNQRLDLTAAKQTDALVEVLLADACALAAEDVVPPNSRCVDVGSGAGAPAVPLVLMRADVSLTMIEPLRKRVAFLRTVLGSLSLVSRAKVIEQKLDPEAPAPSQSADYDVAMSRATFAPPLWLSAGVKMAPRTLVLLAQQPPPEAAEAVLEHSVAYALPFSGAQRKIAIYRRA